jgi:hypothetical protein
MSDTPRTDAEEARYYGKWAKSDFARELEREIAAMREQRDRLAEALELFLNRVQYVSIFMDGKRRGGRFDYRSSGFDDEVELAYEALKAMKGANQ